ncbi:cobaltochelatase subunit CobN [Ancylothrix sp. C2]|uniref:cobaltochelatase subunit CobN n=1 Tax=Ancylothrix sp. D3o TaxID=2953691 RepID=UPI0021BAB465|nr:cobaltochelatase subunit CobN [Ancylothrix sp. D3o]MCT7951822.1 cobaltochelatase subunit CobN [Ancylothrix sp. D3o]
MHRLPTSSGGWNPQAEGLIFVSQTPAPVVFLTAADTDIQTLAAAVSQLPDAFPALRVASLLQLQQQLTIDTYAEEVLQPAKLIVVRLLGGRSYWSYGLEVLRETVLSTGASLIVLPGDERPDPDLISHSTVSLQTVNQLWRYLTEGGVENMVNALLFLADVCLGENFNPPPPVPVPRVGFYPYRLDFTPCESRVGLLFYRAHYLAGNLAPIDALCQALVARNLEPVPVFVSSLRDPDVQAEIFDYFFPKDLPPIQVLLNTTSFAFSQVSEVINPLENPSSIIPNLDVPVLQVILSNGTGFEQWQGGFQGLSPRDMAMNVVLPEVDGRIISRAVSFKQVQSRHPLLETEVVVYKPVPDRIEFVADLTANWVKLRTVQTSERRVALILANYPAKDGRLANGVGLDTPASCVEILQALQLAGYTVDKIPATGEELIEWLTAGVTNDPEGLNFRPIYQSLNFDEYQRIFDELPENVKNGIVERWGEPAEVLSRSGKKEIVISGLQFGNVFVGVQPARGYEIDPSLNYHAPDLAPTHEYLGFYFWLRFVFQTHAIVHVGKHGNLEWLPGKSVALSENCYPEIALGAMPHFYPFIVNDPGEGSQAKRRAQAVIIDHLTPPMTRAELYGSLVQLENLIDEFYEAECLDPSRLPVIQERINSLIVQENLYEDLGLEKEQFKDPRFQLQAKIDSYLCELKEAQIRDGLHIFGRCPENRQLRDLIIAIARYPASGRIGLTRALAADLQWDFDPLTAELSQPLPPLPAANQGEESAVRFAFRTAGDLIEYLEEIAAKIIDEILQGNSPSLSKYLPHCQLETTKELQWIEDYLLPALQQTPQEIANLLRGLEGRFVPSGPSGAPTRGRPEVLPTGRNFYSVDIRSLPTETAWDIGRKAAEVLIENYTQEHGEYPKTLGLSVWGTSTMRTGADDIAEALALIGVRPVWDGPSRRVVDFEILPLSVLDRPRIDVTLRISGFFRDAFSNLIDLFDKAVTAVASLNEPVEQNPIAAKVRQETTSWQAAGLGFEQAQARSLYRVFGSKPGAYGAGLQGLIESQNWTDDEDLARAYINWSSYAYSSQNGSKMLAGISAPEAFKQRLQEMEIVLHNQDNREHDLLDSDDYYQFQGGLTAAVRVMRGENPETYFGDNSLAENPKVRRLKDEIARVYRSRVVNPKWIAGAMRHGYKGAFEMAATVDFLFAYDATARCVSDFMYEGVAKAYLFDGPVREFIEQKNPWALRDMAERLLEANQRGLWESANSQMLEDLRALVNEAELTIEMKGVAQL